MVKKNEKYVPVLVIDFGSQTTQLILRRIREIGVYCEITSSNQIIDKRYGCGFELNFFLFREILRI